MRTEKISIVLPCFNEGHRIYDNIKKIKTYLDANFETYEIIAVSDGGSDNTLSELQKIQQEFPLKIIVHEINRGKGRAVKDGFLASQYDFVMFLDADLAIPIEELEKFLEAIKNGFDIAIASRFVPGLHVKKPVLWYRKIMEKAFRLLRILIVDIHNIKDTQCGFKVFTRSAMLAIFPYLTVDRFAFDSEVLFIAKKRKLKIKELPITLQNPTSSSVRLYRDSTNMFFDLLRIRWNDLTGKYKLKK